jgi:tetratricopeptide (TPR) repeat protein
MGDVLETGSKIEAELGGKEPDSQVRWRLENARGLGFMFVSDYLEDIETKDGTRLDRKAMLHKALTHFQSADGISPENWAVVCNLGSVWMRGAYWKQQPLYSREDDSPPLQCDAFDKSFDYLNNRVVEKLRRNYGFALYEIGRLHRLTKRYDEAQVWFKRAKDVPEKARDVRGATLKREMLLAEKRSDQFP